MASASEQPRTVSRTFSALIPILAILVLISYAYYSFVFILYEPLLSGPERPAAVRALAWLHAILVPWTTAFLLCVLTDPGAIPEDWLSDCTPEDDQEQGGGVTTLAASSSSAAAESDRLVSAGVPTVEKKKMGGLRFCRKCNRFKPDRTHHCSVCRRCVLCMDHHCPWLGNCIGFHNYKYFLLFLIYTVVLIVFLAVHLGLRGVTAPLKVKPLSSFSSAELCVFVCFILGVVVGIAVSALLTFHCYLVLSGHSTIELLEKKNKRMKQNPNGKYENPYDLGPYRNFTRVFGTSPIWWLLPTRRSVPGDGVFFETAKPIMGSRGATYGDEDPLER